MHGNRDGGRDEEGLAQSRRRARNIPDLHVALIEESIMSCEYPRHSLTDAGRGEKMGERSNIQPSSPIDQYVWEKSSRERVREEGEGCHYCHRGVPTVSKAPWADLQKEHQRPPLVWRRRGQCTTRYGWDHT